MEEKQARETLPTRTRIWQWCLGESREPRRSFTLTDLTCLFPKKAHLPVGQAWQISSCLHGQVKGDPMERSGFRFALMDCAKRAVKDCGYCSLRSNFPSCKHPN